MPDLKHAKGTFTWAPKALVVISCALALLAVQPAMGMGVAGREPRRGVVLEGVMPSAHAGLKETSVHPVGTQRTAQTSHSVNRGEAWLGNARKLHILATVEILHRLLVGERQSTQMHLAAGIWIDDICVGLAFVPLVTKGGEEWAAEDRPMRERVFAIAHCLLAPPAC